MLVMVNTIPLMYHVCTDPIGTVSNLHTANTVPVSVVNLSGDV
jgi:hypothetical protein